MDHFGGVPFACLFVQCSSLLGSRYKYKPATIVTYSAGQWGGMTIGIRELLECVLSSSSSFCFFLTFRHACCYGSAPIPGWARPALDFDHHGLSICTLLLLTSGSLVCWVSRRRTFWTRMVRSKATRRKWRTGPSTLLRFSSSWNMYGIPGCVLSHL